MRWNKEKSFTTSDIKNILKIEKIWHGMFIIPFHWVLNDKMRTNFPSDMCHPIFFQIFSH